MTHFRVEDSRSSTSSWLVMTSVRVSKTISNSSFFNNSSNSSISSRRNNRKRFRRLRFRVKQTSVIRRNRFPHGHRIRTRWRGISCSSSRHRNNWWTRMCTRTRCYNCRPWIQILRNNNCRHFSHRSQRIRASLVIVCLRRRHSIWDPKVNHQAIIRTTWTANIMWSVTRLVFAIWSCE